MNRRDQRQTGRWPKIEGGEFLRVNEIELRLAMQVFGQALRLAIVGARVAAGRPPAGELEPDALNLDRLRPAPCRGRDGYLMAARDQAARQLADVKFEPAGLMAGEGLAQHQDIERRSTH